MHSSSSYRFAAKLAVMAASLAGIIAAYQWLATSKEDNGLGAQVIVVDDAPRIYLGDSRREKQALDALAEERPFHGSDGEVKKSSLISDRHEGSVEKKKDRNRRKVELANMTPSKKYQSAAIEKYPNNGTSTNKPHERIVNGKKALSAAHADPIADILKKNNNSK